MSFTSFTQKPASLEAVQFSVENATEIYAAVLEIDDTAVLIEEEGGEHIEIAGAINRQQAFATDFIVKIPDPLSDGFVLQVVGAADFEAQYEGVVLGE